MITTIIPLPVGNGLRVFYKPADTAEYWRILRLTADAFAGPDDANAVLVHEGTDRAPLDVADLINGTEYFYHVWYWDGAQWVDDGGASEIPAAILVDESVDAQVLVRSRLELGLAVEIAAGRLRHEKGRIRCLSAPPQKEGVHFPVVTVQLSQDAPGERFVGEQIAQDDPSSGGYHDYEGWYSSVRLEIVGWSLNPDERITLRQALKKIVIGNLPVFADAGLMQIEFSQQDNEDYQSYGAPMYMTWGTFTCLAPTVTSAEVGEIVETITQITWS